jgi:CheY-like chemotaxis protein
VVDDYPDTRELLAIALREAGFRVAEATDGRGALERAWSLAPDLILMDVSMPGLDGCSATRVLKSDPRSKHIPVIAVTCLDPAGLADLAPQTLFDAVVHKPCLPEDVAALAARVFAEREIA